MELSGSIDHQRFPASTPSSPCIIELSFDRKRLLFEKRILSPECTFYTLYRLNYASLTPPPISTASKLYPLKMLKMLHFITASVFAMHDNFANASITLLWWRDKILLRAVTNSMELNVALAVLWKMIDVNVVFSNLNLFTATSTSSVK